MKFGEVGRTIRLGIIGFGWRGYGQTETLLEMPDVEICAVCDVYPDRVELGKEMVKKARGKDCFGTTDYREVNRMEGIDAVVVMTDWSTHIRIAIDAMNCGKDVAIEVCPASSVQECWDLVHTVEDTGRKFMFLENQCYDDQTLALFNMIRQGVFGELVYASGGYQHDLREEIGNGDIKRHYRQRNFFHRNGEIYPTHELGFIAKALSINRGNRMLALTAMTSKAVGLHEWYEKNRTDRPELARQRVAQGDIAGVMIRCANGEMIYMTHDCTTPHPYNQDFRLQGANGTWRELNHAIYIDGESPKDEWGEGQWEPDKAWLEKYRHPLWKAYEKFGYHGGHDGLDYLTLRAFVEVVQKDGKSPIDVYDAATWMAIGCLSEDSAAMGGSPVPIPDFTNGRWLEREPDVPSWYTLEGIYPEEFEDLK